MPLLLVFSFAETPKEKEEINPEILELIQLKPLPDDFFEKNLYVAQMGFEYPHDDYLEIAEKIIRNDYQHQRKFTDNGRKTIKMLEQSDADYVNNYLEDGEKNLSIESPTDVNYKSFFPCSRYHQLEGCIEKTANNRDKINEAFQQNEYLIQRYQTLAQSFDWINEPNLTPMSALPGYQNFTRLTLLHLAKASIKFMDGDADAGLNILMDEYKELSIYLHKKNQTHLIGMMISVARFQYLDQVLDQLLSAGYLDQHLDDPRVKTLFKPRNQSNKQSVIKALHLEMSTPYIYLVDAQLSPMPTLTEQEELVLSSYSEFIGSSPIDKNRYQVLLQKHSEFAKELNKWRKEDYDAYLQKINIKDRITKAVNTMYYSTSTSIAQINHHYQIFKEFFTQIDGDFMESDIITLDEQMERLQIPADLNWPFSVALNYLYRVEEQNNYHNLLYLKYLIKRDEIANKDIPQFLESMGALAKNRITKEPFSWDAEKRTLSTPLHSIQSTPPSIYFNKTPILIIEF